jgi:hypothetical protein
MDRRDMFHFLGALGFGAAGAAGLSAHDEHSKGEGRIPTPVDNLHAHFCGIHIAKKDPKIQIIAHHYCAPISDEVHQCLLFDSTGKGAKLIGIEYIISDRLYRGLDDAEKKYWHPHTYEVLSGGLIAPEMEPEDEMKFLKVILNTWGKTWHTWPDPKTEVPVGEPLLIWSLTGDGQVDRKVLAARDKQHHVSTQTIREQRARAFGLKVPQMSPPRSLDDIGRQWTDSGDDRPTRTK